MDKVPVVLNPPDRAVLAHDAVFYIIQIVFMGVNLLLDAPLDLLYVIRVDQSGKGVSGIALEFLQVLAAIYPEKGLVGIDQLFIPIRMINEEATGHPRSDLLNDRESLFTEDQIVLIFLFALSHKKPIRPSAVSESPSKFYHFPPPLSSPPMLRF